MKQYKYLLFDLDGTITDSESGITRCVEYALNHFGIQVNDLRELSPFIGPPLMDSFKDFYNFTDEQATIAVAKYRETRPHTDGFQRNNAKCLDEKGISRFVPHSSF